MDMDKVLARQILEETLQRKGNVKKIESDNALDIDFSNDLFDRQISVIDDKSRRKTILAGRRSGKSHCIAYYLVKQCYENPGSNCAYIAISRKSAKQILWDHIQSINDRYKLQAESHITNLTWTFPNGSVITFFGADTEKDIRKHRGSFYNLVVIDECGEFGGHLEYLVKVVLKPTLFDYGGTIVMLGTPGKACGGFWYKTSRRLLKGWSVHDEWTLLDNKLMPRWANKPDWRELAEIALKEEQAEGDYDDESPTWIREWLGKWIEGATALVYNNFQYERNTFQKLPSDISDWQYIMGVDYGMTDPSCILVGAWSPKDPTLYIVDCFKQDNLNPEEMAIKVNEYVDYYKAIDIAVDGNGIGKAYIAQMQSMYNLPIRLAEKRDKVAFIELLNDELRKGKIKVKDDLVEILNEIAVYQWGDSVQKILPLIAEDHCMDSLLYLFRLSSHYIGKNDKKKIKRNSDEYMEKYWEKRIEDEKVDNNQNWWEEMDSGTSFDL